MKLGDVVRILFVIILGMTMALFFATYTSQKDFKNMGSNKENDHTAIGQSNRGNATLNDQRDGKSGKTSMTHQIESRISLEILRWDGKRSSRGKCEVYTRDPMKDGLMKQTREYKDGVCEFDCKGEYARVVIIPTPYKRGDYVEVNGKLEMQYIDLDGDCGPVFLDLYLHDGDRIAKTISLPVAYKIVCFVTDMKGLPVECASVFVWNDGPELQRDLRSIPVGSVGVSRSTLTDENGKAKFFSVMPGVWISVSRSFPLVPEVDGESPYDDPAKHRTIKMEMHAYPSQQNEVIRISLPFDIQDYPYYVGDPYSSQKQNPHEPDK